MQPGGYANASGHPAVNASAIDSPTVGRAVVPTSAPVPGSGPRQAAHTQPPHVWALPRAGIVGAHGGAGTSFLTHLLTLQGNVQVMDAGLAPRHRVSPVEGVRSILVGRSHAEGAAAVTQVLARLHSFGAPPDVLVVMADAPLEPPPVVKQRIQLVSAQVAYVCWIPYVAAARGTDMHRLTLADVGSKTRKALAALARVLGNGVSGAS